MNDTLIQDTSAERLISRFIAWDNHACMPLRPNDDFISQLERHRQAGFSAITLNIGFDLTPALDNFRVLATFRHWVLQHPDRFLLVKTVEDIRGAKRSGRLGVLFDLEGTRALCDQVSLIPLYYELGVRWMLMAYNQGNSAGGGCQDSKDDGLSAFGRQVIDEMTRVGMVVCCSHTGWNTARDVLDYASGPVIFSHSNAYAVCPHPRNIPDDLIRACAQSGGVVGLNGLSRFLGKTSDGQYDNSTEALFRHLDHMVQLVGADHVGLGLDYVFDLEELKAFYRSRPDLFPPEKGYVTPTPMVEPERLRSIVQMMLAHGYPIEDISKILGGNHLRVAEEVWK